MDTPTTLGDVIVIITLPEIEATRITLIPTSPVRAVRVTARTDACDVALVSDNPQSQHDVIAQQRTVFTAKTLGQRIQTLLQQAKPTLTENLSLTLLISRNELRAVFLFQNETPTKIASSTFDAQDIAQALQALVKTGQDTGTRLWKLRDSHDNIAIVPLSNPREAHLVQRALSLNTDALHKQIGLCPPEVHTVCPQPVQNPKTLVDSPLLDALDALEEACQSARQAMKARENDNEDILLETETLTEPVWKGFLSQKHKVSTQITHNTRDNTQPEEDVPFEITVVKMAMTTFIAQLTTHPVFLKQGKPRLHAHFLAEGWDTLLGLDWEEEDQPGQGQHRREPLIAECEDHRFFQDLKTFVKRLLTLSPEEDTEDTPYKLFSVGHLKRPVRITANTPMLSATTPQQAAELFKLMFPNGVKKHNPDIVLFEHHPVRAHLTQQEIQNLATMVKIDTKTHTSPTGKTLTQT